MPSPTQLRDQAARLAPENVSEAVKIAETIEDPWFRTQALGWAVRYALDDHDAERFARLAIESAADADDAYRQVAPCAWPLRALIERGLRDFALELLEIVLTAVPRIQANASRAEALSHLLHAMFDTSEEIRRSLAFALRELADEDEHWRVQRAIRDALRILYPVDPDFAVKLGIQSEPDGSYVTETPRPFFW
ncbi:MAG: hypothetical protein AAF196_00715 [Planctomycetota bacterium]